MLRAEEASPSGTKSCPKDEDQYIRMSTDARLLNFLQGVFNPNLSIGYWGLGLTPNPAPPPPHFLFTLAFHLDEQNARPSEVSSSTRKGR